ncbi:putative ATP-dependent RNA helicase dhr2 [Arthrobotrys conoides]|uniref:RNA helicase n=1 Tax=Arthrobotrys conoides TaxID=74498 RepID=A0AAN8P1H6_9PEZI
MFHPNKRQKVQDDYLASSSISALSKTRLRQQHDALQETLRSSTGQGKKTKFFSESPEPAGRSVPPLPPIPKTSKRTGTEKQSSTTNGGINEVEAIELRQKNEKARKKLERKKRKLADKERADKEAEDGGYSSWNGFSDGQEPESNTAPPRKIRKKFVEEAVVLEKPVKASKEKRKRAKSPPITKPPATKSIVTKPAITKPTTTKPTTTKPASRTAKPEQPPKEQKRKRQEDGDPHKPSLKRSKKPATKVESPVFPAIPEGTTDFMLPSSILAPPAARKRPTSKVESPVFPAIPEGTTDFVLPTSILAPPAAQKTTSKRSSPVFPAIPEGESTDFMLPESLLATIFAQKPAKAASKKIESVWDRLKSKPKKSSTSSSTEPSKMSLVSGDPVSDNSMTTAEPSSKPSSEPQTDPQKTHEVAPLHNKVEKEKLLQSKAEAQQEAPLQNKTYKNLPPQDKTKNHQEVPPQNKVKKKMLSQDKMKAQQKAPLQNKVYKNLPPQDKVKAQQEAPLQNGVEKKVLPQEKTKARHEAPLHNKLFKNVLSSHKSNSEQEVGNDSTAGLVDPLTPLPLKPPVKSKEQISRELQMVRKSLPIWDFQDEIRTTIRDSNSMVLVGETGSGKSTQIGQFLLNQPCMSKMTSAKGKKYGGCIAITQPRRVAAISLAQRVSSEMGTTLGKEVGYCVRFDNMSDHSTKIRYITDGMLLNEILHDPELSRYSVIVVDEAHERSVSTDLGMGLLKGIVEIRRKKQVPLKLIVMSATLNVEKMASYVGGNPETGKVSAKFPRAPICQIPGKIFPVEVFYTPASIDNFQTAAAKTIFQVHYQQPCPGDILVFSTGSEEIEELASMVEELALQMEPDKPKLNVMRLYASLDPVEQQKVFVKGNPKERKVIIATNIAETSVTVPGVRHVIDCGKVKMKRFRHQLGIESLLVTDISQASAQQRKGRAGREAPGTCYRLYTQDYFKQLQKETEPEILHCDLAGAMLTLLAMKSENSMDTVNNFPFLDGPSHQSKVKALTTLHELGAINDNGNISDVGKKMSKFPLPPVQSRVIVAASEEEQSNQNSEENILVDVIDVLSCLSVDGNIIMQPARWKKTLAEPKEKSDPLLAKKKKRKHADEEDSDQELTLEEKVQNKRMEIVHPSGDHITYLNILRRYLSRRPSEQKKFCQEYQISYPLMRKVENIRKQLRGYCRLDKVGELPRDSEMKHESDTLVARYPRVSAEQTEKIIRCFMKGVGVENIAKRTNGRNYRTLTSTGNMASAVDMSVHPSSCLMWESIEREVKRSKKDIWGGGGHDREQSKIAREAAKRKEGFGEAVMYQDVVWTSKAFMKCVSKIKLAWTAEVFEGLALFSQ